MRKRFSRQQRVNRMVAGVLAFSRVPPALRSQARPPRPTGLADCCWPRPCRVWRSGSVQLTTYSCDPGDWLGGFRPWEARPPGSGVPDAPAVRHWLPSSQVTTLVYDTSCPVEGSNAFRSVTSYPFTIDATGQPGLNKD